MRPQFRSGHYARRRFAKAVCFAMTIVAAITLFAYTLLTSSIYEVDNYIMADVNDLFLPLVGAGVLFILHLVYLIIVGYDQIFKDPHDELKYREAVLLLLLTATYLLPFLIVMLPIHRAFGLGDEFAQAMMNDRLTLAKLTATACFAIVYTYWAVVDYHELQEYKRIEGKSVPLLSQPISVLFGKSTSHRSLHGHASPGESLETIYKSMWMGLDIFLAITLWASMVLYEFFADDGLYKLTILGHFGLKDVAVVIALAARVFTMRLVRLAITGEESIKHRGWQRAIRRITEPGIGRPASQARSDEDHVLSCTDKCSIIINCTKKNESPGASGKEHGVPGQVLNCMIVNCGTGERTKQVLRRIQVSSQLETQSITPDYQVNLFGYSHDCQIKDRFISGDWVARLEHPELVVKRKFTDNIDVAKKWLDSGYSDDSNKIDVVIVLHSTYDSEEAARVEQLTSELTAGTVVIVRGFADHSMLATVCYQHSDRGLLPVPYYHRWNHGFLREMAARHNWFIITPYSQKPQQVIKPDVPPRPDSNDGYYPVKVIRQTLDMERDKIEDAIAYLSMQLSEEAAKGLRAQLVAMSASVPEDQKSKINCANVDDYVYCFVVGEQNGEVDDSRVAVEYGDSCEQNTLFNFRAETGAMPADVQSSV